MPLGALYGIAGMVAMALGAVAATPARHVPASTRAALPPSALSVWTGKTWREWWRSDAAPDRWLAPHNAVSDAIMWKRASDGVDWGELRLAGIGEA